MSFLVFVDYYFICGFSHVTTKSYGTLEIKLLPTVDDRLCSINPPNEIQGTRRQHCHDSQVLYLYILTRNAHAHILPRAGHGRRLRTISRPYQSTHACMHTHTRGTPRTHACMCTHTRVTFRPESKSDLGSCETIRRDWLKRDKSSLARA